MNFTTRALLPEEFKYAAEQSYQLMTQTGFVGVMKGDFWEDCKKGVLPEKFDEELKTALSFFGRERQNYRADIGNISFLIVGVPQEYILVPHCYCYNKDRLDSHMEKAKRGIRFITSGYKEKFRIPDGGKIAVTYGYNGEREEFVCRYIDDTHLELGTGKKGAHMYHIGELADRMEKNGNRCEPINTKSRSREER